MDLTNEFTVSTSIDEAWALLTDVARIAPCVPGFELTEAGDDGYRGSLRVKVGAVTMRYESRLRFVERDESAHRAVIEAEGQEVGGQGGVSARIVSQLSVEDGRTKAVIVTSLTVTGRAAQFGRGILGDVSNRLVDLFVSCLETRLVASAPPPTAEVTDEVEPPVRKVHYEPSEPIDLVSVAGGAVLKRLLPAVALLGLLALLLARGRRR